MLNKHAVSFGRGTLGNQKRKLVVRAQNLCGLSVQLLMPSEKRLVVKRGNGQNAK